MRRLRLQPPAEVCRLEVLQPQSVLATMAASGEVSLRAFLEKNHVHADIVAFLARSNCDSVLQFSEWVDEKKDLKTAVMDQVASVKEDRGAYAALKVAWSEAQAITKKTLERRAAGIEDSVEEDHPLPPDVQKNVESRFEDFYNWRLDGDRFGDDFLLGPASRESHNGEASPLPRREGEDSQPQQPVRSCRP